MLLGNLGLIALIIATGAYSDILDTSRKLWTIILNRDLWFLLIEFFRLEILGTVHKLC